MKLIVNMAMGTMMTTLAESLTLADKSGLSQEQLLEVLGLGVMANPMFKMKVSFNCSADPVLACQCAMCHMCHRQIGVPLIDSMPHARLQGDTRS